MKSDIINYSSDSELTPPTNALIEIEKSRAVQEVQAAMLVAKRFPRDSNAAFIRIMDACKRPTLAAVALYSYPRGGQTITGPSIRLAEVLAQNYGNLEFGVRELERQQGRSIAESYCWDIETNVRQVKIFEVPHEIGTKQGKKLVSDPRDIYELVANMGARRLRACILGIIPADIREAAEDRCRRTLAQGGGEPITDRARKLLMLLKEFGIDQAMIEKRLGHKLDIVSSEEIVELLGIYNSLKDGHGKRSDFFDFPSDKPESTPPEPKAGKVPLSEKLAKKVESPEVIEAEIE